MTDQQLKTRLDEIVHDDSLTIDRKRVEAGKAVRQTIQRLKDEGKTEAEIAEATGLRTTRVRELNALNQRAKARETLLKETNLSMTDRFKIDGPWGHKDLQGMTVPVFVFQPGTGARLEVGKVTANTDHGLKFEVKLDDEYKDLDVVSFNIPMRFHVRVKREES